MIKLEDLKIGDKVYGVHSDGSGLCPESIVMGELLMLDTHPYPCEAVICHSGYEVILRRNEDYIFRTYKEAEEKLNSIRLQLAEELLKSEEFIDRLFECATSSKRLCRYSERPIYEMAVELYKQKAQKKVIINKVGLIADKKETLKDLMGSASSEQIDFNKVRDEYKYDTYEERLIKSNTIDLRDNSIVHDLGNGFSRVEPINKNKTVKASKVAKHYIYDSLSYFDFLEDLFKGDIEYSLTNEEVAEVCYAIDKSMDEYMISNNETCKINMSNCKTIKLDHDSYILKWINSTSDFKKRI